MISSPAAVVIVAVLVFPNAALPQNTAAVTADTTVVKAGEQVNFIVTVDQPTNIEDCLILFAIRGAGNTYGASVGLPPGQTKVTISYRVPADSAGGRFTLSGLVLLSPSGKQVPLDAKQVSFDVIPKTGAQYPNRAQVVLSPSQVQLFRTEALAVARRLQELKGNERTLQASEQEAATAILRNAIAQELEALKRTAGRFNALGSNPELSRTAKEFFDDLEFSYRRTQFNLGASAPSAAQNWAQPVMKNAFFWQIPAQKRDSLIPFAQDAVYRAVEQNELAYNLVADASDMSFDLRVVSTPAGASVSYARRGDSFKDHPVPTSATIQSLPLAIWIVRFHKATFRDQEREFNPFTERDREVDVILQPLGK